MLILKRIFFLVMVFICGQGLAAGICVNSSIVPTLNADVLFLGPQMAFQDSNFSDYKTFPANNNIEFSRQVQQLAPKTCSVILGLVTSSECLIAGPVLKKNKIVGMSPCCGHDSIRMYYPYIYVGSAPLSKEVSVIVNHLNGEKNVGKIFAIYKPTDVYSNEMFSQFKKQFKKSYTEIRLNIDDRFDIDKFSYQKDQPVNLVFFSYPLPSVKALVSLSNHQLITKDTVIIGGSSWGDEVTLFKSIKPILTEAKKVFCVEMIDWEKIKNSGFVKRFTKKYGREPLDIEIISYDITGFAVKCYKEAFADGKYNVKTFQYCLAHDKYHGVSGDFLFTKHSPFANRPIYLTNLLNRI